MTRTTYHPGSPRLADRYGVELMRIYDHYRFRYFAKLLRLQQVQPLSADASWTNPYFQAGSLKELSRRRFSGR